MLAVKPDDVRAWQTVRNPAAHGAVNSWSSSQDELQTLLDGWFRVLNLVNRVALRLVGYEGPYKDYSQHSWPEISFPAEIRKS